MTEWLIEDVASPEAIAASVVEFGDRAPRSGRAGRQTRQPGAIGVRFHDITVHNNKKWIDIFHGADVRMDVVVVEGNVIDDASSQYFAPSTFRFPNVGDGDRLQTDESGLLVYFGRPRHFLDISMVLSRDRTHGDELAALLREAANSPEMAAATGIVAALTGQPAVLVVSQALKAATTIGDLVYRLVAGLGGSTIGLYHGSRLAGPEHFGIGRNPGDGSTYRKNDMSFWYEVVRGV